MKIDYGAVLKDEALGAIAAKYGKFVQGASAPGGNGDNDGESGDLTL